MSPSQPLEMTILLCSPAMEKTQTGMQTFMDENPTNPCHSGTQTHARGPNTQSPSSAWDCITTSTKSMWDCITTSIESMWDCIKPVQSPCGIAQQPKRSPEGTFSVSTVHGLHMYVHTYLIVKEICIIQ